jgi:hypothetical protein
MTPYPALFVPTAWQVVVDGQAMAAGYDLRERSVWTLHVPPELLVPRISPYPELLSPTA